MEKNIKIPRNMEIVVVIFAGRPRVWTHKTTGENMKSMAYDWVNESPIPMGIEDKRKSKSWAMIPIGTVHIDRDIKKFEDWNAAASRIAQTNFDIGAEELKKIIQQKIDEQAKLVVFLSLAHKLGRENCNGNKLLVLTSHFNPDNIDWNDHPQSWNKILAKTGSYWSIR